MALVRSTALPTKFCSTVTTWRTTRCPDNDNDEEEEEEEHAQHHHHHQKEDEKHETEATRPRKSRRIHANQ